MKLRLNASLFMLAFAILSLPMDAVGQPVRWYVDASAGSGGDGEDWSTALKFLQDALDGAASIEGPDEIWVADGTYYPSAQADPNEPRTATFSLASGVQIYGGFRGADDSDPNNPYLGESTRSERNPEQNVTILSGNIGSPSSSADNCLHVVSASFVDNSAVLSGFTVQDGRSDISGLDRGAGLEMQNSRAVITNCVFRQNYAQSGGAVYNLGPAIDMAQFVNCTFVGNKALSGDGGAIYSLMGRLSFTNCLFVENSAVGAGRAVQCR